MQSHNKMMAWSCFFIVSAVLVFVRAKIGEKCQAHNYLACNLVANLLGRGTKKVGTERKIVCRRLENHSPEIEKSFAAEKTRAKEVGLAECGMSFYFLDVRVYKYVHIECTLTLDRRKES